MKIEGLQSEAGKLLNGLEGIVDHYSKSKERYGIRLPGETELKMIKPQNLRASDGANSDYQVFSGEAEMMEHLKSMGMPESMLQNLTPSQKKEMFEMTKRKSILERAKKAAGIDNLEEEVPLKYVDNGLYAWKDTGDQVIIEVTGCTGNVRCDFQNDFIHIQHDDNTVVQGHLFQSICPKESKWETSTDGTLTVKLRKLQPMRWLMITR